MSAATQTLRRLHRILIQQSDINGQLERGPKMIKASETSYQLTLAAEKSHREAVKQKRMDADRKQLQLRDREAKIFSLEGKMNQCKTDREYQTLKDQIAADTQANAVLSDEILEILEEIDSLVAATPEFQNRTVQSKSESERLTSSINERRAVLESDLVRVTSEYQTVRDELEGDLKQLVLRLVALRNEDALAPLEGKACSGCNTSLSPRSLDRLHLDEPITCTSCGRLIYAPERR